MGANKALAIERSGRRRSGFPVQGAGAYRESHILLDQFDYSLLPPGDPRRDGSLQAQAGVLRSLVADLAESEVGLDQRWGLLVRIGGQLAAAARWLEEDWWPVWLHDAVGIHSSLANECLAIRTREASRRAGQVADEMDRLRKSGGG